MKQRFIEIFKANVTRKGCDKLLEWLISTDFFEAPASTKFHASYKGGLLEHSLNVYDVMMSHHYNEDTDSLESFTICTLLHDVCKAGFYKLSSRNVKNEAGKWEQVPYYTIEDKFPFGHGEKSVFLIERFMKLELSEAMAIRWHMGGFDETVRAGGFGVSAAFELYPIAVKLHLSDLEASYLHEKKG